MWKKLALSLEYTWKNITLMALLIEVHALNILRMKYKTDRLYLYGIGIKLSHGTWVIYIH